MSVLWLIYICVEIIKLIKKFMLIHNEVVWQKIYEVTVPTNNSVIMFSIVDLLKNLNITRLHFLQSKS